MLTAVSPSSFLVSTMLFQSIKQHGRSVTFVIMVKKVLGLLCCLASVHYESDNFDEDLV